LQNQFTNRKAELEADLEAEALPEALTFCWMRKRRKRKRLGWKRKRKQYKIDRFRITGCNVASHNMLKVVLAKDSKLQKFQT
jgi:hypothetical protein